MKNPIYLMAGLAILLVACVILVMFYEPPPPNTGLMNASHILIKFKRRDASGEPIERTPEEALKLAEEIYAKAIEEDANFAALARTYSEDTSSEQGGDLGNFKPKQMIPEFTQATKELRIGEISKPVESQYGYHIILRKEIAR